MYKRQLSSFDPVRREIARVSLEKLITDGRIHPARIEETVDKARREVEATIKQAGERAVVDAGVNGVHPELVKLLGKLKYRTSYGQNVLNHSLEVSYIAGLMASEIGADIKTARRAGLLHDIGKALDHEFDGSHVELGVEYAKRFRENEAVVHAIQAHHGDVEPKTIVACLVQAADAISAARPGARRENVQNYIKRLEKLEEIANSFEGVDRSFAIQAAVSYTHLGLRQFYMHTQLYKARRLKIWQHPSPWPHPHTGGRRRLLMLHESY